MLFIYKERIRELLRLRMTLRCQVSIIGFKQVIKSMSDQKIDNRYFATDKKLLGNYTL